MIHHVPYIAFYQSCSNDFILLGKHSGSVVEYLTRDRGAEGSRLTGITVSCP